MFSELVLNAKKYIQNLLAPLEGQWFYFHNLWHTLDVFQRVNYLIKKENVNDDLGELLQLAALFHDSGCVVSYIWHERYSFEQLKSFLKTVDIYYPEDRIDIIRNIIYCTEVWQEPTNILEKIIKDADLDNLGRDDFFEKTDNLKKETYIIQWIDYSLLQWHEKTLNLLEHTKYYTKTQISERRDNLKNNIILLKKEIKKLKNL